MAHTLSAKKRNRQNLKCNARNRWRKRRVKDAVKTFDEIADHHGSPGEAEAAFRTVAAALDRCAGTGTIHRNRAARKKSRLAKKIAALKTSSTK